MITTYYNTPYTAGIMCSDYRYTSYFYGNLEEGSHLYYYY